jgi:hypothetical protein
MLQTTGIVGVAGASPTNVSILAQPALVGNAGFDTVQLGVNAPWVMLDRDYPTNGDSWEDELENAEPAIGYGHTEKQTDVDNFFEPYRVKYKNLWDQASNVTSTLSLSGNPELFENLKTFRQENEHCGFIPYLKLGMESKEIMEDFIQNESFCLIALDDIPLSLALSGLINGVKQTFKQELDECKTKLIRTNDTSSARTARKMKANSFAETIEPIVRDLEQQGFDTLQSVADRLNELGFKTRNEKDWTPTAIYRLRERTKNNLLADQP